jgi:hypothetical protein
MKREAITALVQLRNDLRAFAAGATGDEHRPVPA